jgi:hypothetical protein
MMSEKKKKPTAGTGNLLGALALAGLCGGLIGSFPVFVVALIVLLSACTLAGGCRC